MGSFLRAIYRNIAWLDIFLVLWTMNKIQERKRLRASSQNLDARSGIQITDALKVQMEVQTRLQEQLEEQRQLQHAFLLLQ